jgi:hypothetical protein
MQDLVLSVASHLISDKMYEPRPRVRMASHTHDDQAAQLGCGVQEPGVIGLGEALAGAGTVAAAAVGTVDQAGPLAGLDADQRGQRAVAGGHPYYQSVAAPTRVATLWQQTLEADKRGRMTTPERRTAHKYSNVVGRERLRQAATG